ncbi:hypothetical protein GCM10009096_02100 [Parasphingorhabdus litoris]|uniref:HTH tetR-type domain-containing protein n=1 Tax=Parasphingorhabdus litoris TaxID=394733 RepID=A0ABN1A187_9SPHN|nr:TetR/AcrR family transcriptional regulator [Parasphingorhabdus litoris]
MATEIDRKNIKGVTWPKQNRSVHTFEKLLESAQTILQRSGLEALNSNAIADDAGVTAPVFYRYFEDKYALLAVLGHRLTDAQNELYEAAARLTASQDMRSRDQFEKASFKLLSDTYKLTAAFTGSHALLISLRALPELSDIRLTGNDEMAKVGGNSLRKMRPNLSMKDATERARVSIELGYSVIEMLLEVPSMSRKRVLERTNKAVMAVFFDG